MSFERDLDATGTTVRCHVTHEYDDRIERVLRSLLEAFPIRRGQTPQDREPSPRVGAPEGEGWLSPWQTPLPTVSLNL